MRASRVLAPDASEARAAPAGGPFWGRGCTSAAAFLAAASAFAEPLDTPSGLTVAFHDTIRDTLGDGLTLRFRFVAPEIGGNGPGFIDVADDMAHLCTTYAVPRIAEIGPQPARIVVTLMSEPTAFGVANPSVTQFFESYSIEDGDCIWEFF